jgi:hypothetical protein
VRNGAGFIAEAIESVLAQEGVDLTVRVRDNLSSDDSVAIAERYANADPRVEVAVNEREIGYYGSLNRILAGTDADFYVPFAADDVMRPGNLAAKLEALADPAVGFAHSPAELIDEHGASLGRQWPEPVGMPPPGADGAPSVTPAPEYLHWVMPLNGVHTQASVIRTAGLRAIGGFDARPDFCADWFAYLRLSMRWAVATFPGLMIGARLHGGSGTTAGHATGNNARDVPAALDHAFTDPAMPGEWQSQRDRLVAAALAHVGRQMNDAGRRRVADGFSSYMSLSRALARVPQDEGIYAQFAVQVHAAGLTVPTRPFEAVAEAPLDAGEARQLADAVFGLGPLVERLILAVAPERVDATMEALDPVFGDSDLDVVLTPAADLVAVLVPGRLVIARWGSDAVPLAEGNGIPVHPYGIPDPFAGPPDAGMWQIVEGGSDLG